MKHKVLAVFWIATLFFSMNSCSSDKSENKTPIPSVKNNTPNLYTAPYLYSSIELETMDLINAHRVSKGLNLLEPVSYISYKSQEHDNYMIANNVLDHYDFNTRSANIMQTLGASSVAENVASNYKTAQEVFKGWLNSEGHKKNMEGNFTHFGIAIKQNPANGTQYFTTIFAKI